MNKDLEKFLDLIVDAMVEEDLKKLKVDSNSVTGVNVTMSSQATIPSSNARTGNFPS